MLEDTLKPALLWGQHRSSELLVMSIKDRLTNDKEVSKAVTFIEFPTRKYDDYLQALVIMRQIYDADGSCARFWREETADKIELHRYEASLRREYGPLVFNLHDHYKVPGLEWDIQFRIPKYIKEDEKLASFLKNLGNRYMLGISFVHYKPKPEDSINLISPDNIVVEFAVPSPEKIMRFPTKEAEESLRLCFPQIYRTTSSYMYQVPDTTNQDFIWASKQYAAFMKDALLRVSSLDLHKEL